MPHILIVEDEEHIARMIEATLELGGYTCEWCADGAAAVERVHAAAYDLVLLDVMLPGLDGFGVCRALREEGNPLPILMLTARTGVADKVEGLDCGADDYMTKPFAPEELLARIRALTRRQGEAPARLEPAFADLRLDASSHTLCRGEKSVGLSPKEFELLRLLMSRPGAVCPKGEILETLWGGAEDNNLEAYISFLRKKLFYLGSRASIATLRKVGYRLEDPGEEPMEMR